MQFSNGFWLMKEGYQCFSPEEVYFAKKNTDSLVLLAPTTKIVQRGDTLQGVNLEIKITTPMPEVIRLQVIHHKGKRKKGPEYELNLNEEKIDIDEDKDNLYVKSGMLRLIIDKENCNMKFERNGEIISKISKKDLAYIQSNWSGYAYVDKKDKSYMRQQLSLGVGELIYGLGEHFTAFTKNSQSLDLWNEDGGTNTQQSYKNIPFFISNKGYGVFVNHPEKVSFEIATENVARTQFSVEGESLDYFFINGPTMKDTLVRYTDITGKPSLPAAWTFGLWLSTSFTTNYDEETVMSFIDGMIARDIPLRVFHFDCFWMKDFHWSNFKWDERVFPDPEGMIKRIKDKGLNVCVWINPYIAQESELFEEAMREGYLIKDKEGDVWQWDMWQPGMAIVDFTNPKASEWFANKLAILLDMGVDCFKTDFGERIPVDVEYHDKSDSQKMHNYYTYLYNKTIYELLQKKRGEREAVLFARSATVGGQKFPVHWGGDCWSDFEAMEQSLRGGLSLCMSGFGYWSHDIGGFESTSTADVYKRWAAFGLLSSHSRLHGSTSYRVPWAYDEESVEVVRKFTKLKNKLMPYIFSEAVYTSDQGIPMMRSMVLEFTEDRNCSYLDKQYMLGKSLMVAPVFNEESFAEYYLPEGKWTSILSGDIKDGGKWYKEKIGYLDIPLYVRENSIIPIGSCDMKPDYDYFDDLECHVYNLLDKEKASVSIYNKELSERVDVSILRDGNKISIELSAQKEITFRFVNLKLQSDNLECCTIVGEDTVICCKDKIIRLRIMED